ncbi:MAG: glycosyl transferase family 51 [Myxococcales bacterium]|nr:glycosyl transferase family 51 [Myxococcales bacterium]
MRFPPISRRWLIAGGIGIGTLFLVTIALAVVYPRVGAWMIRHKLGGKLQQKLGRDVRFGDIDVSLGHAVMRNIEIRGPLDGDMPLVHVDRIDVDFDAWHSLIGTVELGAATVDGVIVTLRRDAEGRDNIRDVIDRLRTDDHAAASGGGKSPRPTSITVTHGRLLADDAMSGTTALVADADAKWSPEGLAAHVRGVTATTTGAPKATLQSIDITKLPGTAPIVSLGGGELELWPKMALSGIGGKIVADPDKPGHYIIDLAGGYGGVPGTLWTAKGELDPKAITASLDLEAAKFQLERLAPILEHSAVVDYQSTSIDTALHIEADAAGAKFSGELHLRGLNVGHPMIAAKEVHDLDLSAQVAGAFDRASHKLDLTRGDFVVRNVPFSITGTIDHPRRAVSLVPPPPAVVPVPTPPAPGTSPTAAPADPAAPELYGPHGIQIVKLRLVIPPIDCQRFLTAIPGAMAPYLAGYRLRGVFDADIHLDIDWRDLDATELGGHIGINHCRVIDEPADSPKRLKDEFEHYVEVEQGEWISFIVGPTNPDFVPLDQISPFLIKSIMSTEDFAFYQHHGFITSEFRTALVNDLKKSDFVQGASSITMQMVKNVLLYREKTLARKLQELFLTWHVENTLEKERIMEIYLNVIEYGPGLYGIGPAARHFFGKPAKDLNMVESAFFSTILPSPKERYKQYCQGTFTRWTTEKIQRILANELKRNMLTKTEYDQAMATPLLFVKDGSETEDDCMKRVKKAIKNARSTNPLKAKPDVKPATPHKKHKRS